MKLKKFTFVDSGDVYELVEDKQLYVTESGASDITVKALSSILDEGKISFVAEDIITETDLDLLEAWGGPKVTLDIDFVDDDTLSTRDNMQIHKIDLQKWNVKVKRYSNNTKAKLTGPKESVIGWLKDNDYDLSVFRKELSEDQDLDLLERTLKENLEKVLNFKIDISDELFESTELSEGFKESSKTLFESLVREKAKEIASQASYLYSTYAKELTEHKDKLNQQKISDYLDYVVTEWLADNKVAVDNSIKTEMNENFLNGLAELFKEHYIDIPDERYDILEGLANKVKELEESLESEVQTNVKLMSESKKLVKESVTKELSKDLTESQTEKFLSLLENISDLDVEKFEEKAGFLKKSFFKENTTNEDNLNHGIIVEANNITEDEQNTNLSSLDKLIAQASAI